MKKNNKKKKKKGEEAASSHVFTESYTERRFVTFPSSISFFLAVTWALCICTDRRARRWQLLISDCKVLITRAADLCLNCATSKTLLRGGRKKIRNKSHGRTSPESTQVHPCGWSQLANVWSHERRETSSRRGTKRKPTVMSTYWSSATFSCMTSTLRSISAEASPRSSLLLVRSLMALERSSCLLAAAACESCKKKKKKSQRRRFNSVAVWCFKAKDYLVGWGSDKINSCDWLRAQWALQSKPDFATVPWLKGSGPADLLVLPEQLSGGHVSAFSPPPAWLMCSRVHAESSPTSPSVLAFSAGTTHRPQTVDSFRPLACKTERAALGSARRHLHFALQGCGCGGHVFGFPLQLWVDHLRVLPTCIQLLAHICTLQLN